MIYFFFVYFIFVPMSVLAQPLPAYHALIHWTPWDFDHYDPAETALALRSTEINFEVQSWQRSSIDLDSTIRFQSDRPQGLSFQNTVRSVVNSALVFDGLSLVDIVIKSHGDPNFLLTKCGENIGGVDFGELRSFLFSQVRRLAKAKKSKVRLFLDYCHSGAILKSISRLKVPTHVEVEIYTSTDKNGASYGNELLEAIESTQHLLGHLEQTPQTGFDLFYPIFKSLGRFSDRYPKSEDHHPIQVWTSRPTEKNNEQEIVFDFILRFFRGKDKFKVLLDLGTPDTALESLFGALEKADNKLVTSLFTGEPPNTLSEVDRLNYQILQVRTFFTSSPGAKETLQYLVNHSDPVVRYIAIQTMCDYTPEFVEPFFREGKKLIYQAYWSELKKPNWSSANIHLILDHLIEIKDRSREAQRITKDWAENSCTRVLSDRAPVAKKNI